MNDDDLEAKLREKLFILENTDDYGDEEERVKIDTKIKLLRELLGEPVC